ncbi:MAG: hypothetical protein M3495_13915 [Pseudomonadota bacterium]|nr:hypothetical protein [Pseudomonadota bacterium]
MLRRVLTIIILLALPLQLLAIDSERFRQLRDQGIKNIGWVAGNAAGHPIWPQVEPFVGKGGNYYNALIRLKTPGANEEVEAYSNVAIYREWVQIGEKTSFNEDECITRIQRTLQLVDELTKMMKASK